MVKYTESDKDKCNMIGKGFFVQNVKILES